MPRGRPPPDGSVRELLALALPITATRLGITMMLVVDHMVVGHAGTADLAAWALALMLVHTAQNVGLGLLIGGLVEISAALGARDAAGAGAAYRRSLVYAVAIGVLGCLASLFLSPLFAGADLSPAVRAEAERIVLVLGVSLVPMLVFLASVMLLEALGRPWVALWILIAGNGVNLLLDLVLVFGLWGPALGGEGAAWATLAARIAMAAAALLYVARLLPERAGLGAPSLAEHAWGRGRRQRRLGYAEGASMGIESGSFAAMTFFASRMGAVELAAYSILVNILMFLFTIAVGVGSALAVLVARARGAASPERMARTARRGFVLFVGITLPMAFAMLSGAGAIAGLYTADPALVAVATPLVAVLGFVFVLDGAQRVVGNALRGYGEAWWPTASHLFSYVVVMMPLGWLLGLSMAGGAAGLLVAIAIASVVASALLFARFVFLSSRPVAGAPAGGAGGPGAGE